MFTFNFITNKSTASYLLSLSTSMAYWVSQKTPNLSIPPTRTGAKKGLIPSHTFIYLNPTCNSHAPPHHHPHQPSPHSLAQPGRRSLCKTKIYQTLLLSLNTRVKIIDFNIHLILNHLLIFATVSTFHTKPSQPHSRSNIDCHSKHEVL